MDTPVKLEHYHQWFSTGAMKYGQRRCIECGMWGEEYDAQGARIKELERELAEARKNAERYKFLRNRNSVIQWRSENGTECYGGSADNEMRRKWTDEAIDAALSQSRDDKPHIRPGIAEKG